MPAWKTLLTGPYGAEVREPLLREERSEPSGLWLVPTPLARAQVLEALGRVSERGRTARVWCWADLWRAVRDGRDDGPARLSDAGSRAVLALAIGRAREARELNATAAVAHWPGFRRRVRDRIALWTRRELSPDRDPPETGPTVADEWAIFGHYRAILRTLEAEDAEGFANWAARVLEKSPPPGLKRLGTVTILDPADDDAPAVRRAFGFFEAKAKGVRVVLGYDPDPALSEVFSAVAPFRERLIERGYEESAHAPDLWRPPALRDVERELFRSDAPTRPKLKNAGGLKLLGAPQGEGVGLVVAREVRGWLEQGAAPEDVLILVRNWDEDAEAVLSVLRSWGLPVSALGRPQSLASEPAVSALRMALRLRHESWEASELVKLLRHGRVRPDWPTAQGPDALARAAAAVRDSGVFRGKEPILQAIGRSRPNEPAEHLRRAEQARDLVKTLTDEIEPIGRSGSWSDHVGRLKRVAGSLGIGGEGDHPLERFWNALDDQAAVFDVAGGGRPVPLGAFVEAVERLTGDHREVEMVVTPGTVRVATIDQAVGAGARFVVLANLAEGTFPTREAVESAEDDGVGRSFAREMARFLRVVGSAAECLVLAYPTRDEKGQEVLPAGFLDDLTRRFDPVALDPVHRKVTRFDPTLMEHPDLVGSPADARVRAVALACVQHDPGELARLATDPIHRTTLAGTAAALTLTAHRLDPRGFTPYDGHLIDPAVPRSLVLRFGPDAIFSPSQLESFLLCPFQFFLKYVLKLIAIDDRDELDENFIARGNRIHKVLEDYERLRLESGASLSIDDFVISTVMKVAFSDESEANPGLDEIERRRVEQTFRRYVEQARDYARRPKEPSARPSQLEVVFGDERDANPLPCVVIGEGADAVKIQGKIDRVDTIEGEHGPAFRVIDYKTGSPPSKKDVTGFLMVQLPLYALAVEHLNLAGESARPRDVGYWDLREKGYSKIDLDDWPETKARLEAAVIDAVAKLRDGRFVVNPRKDDCTRYCDYATVCRIGQIRVIDKASGRDTP